MFTPRMFSPGPGTFAPKRRDPLIGLDPNRQHVRIDLRRSRPTEQGERRPPELDRDLGHPSGERLAGPNVERDAGPSPRIDAELERDVGFGLGIGGHLRFVAVGRDLLARDPAGDVLAADRVVGHVLGAHRSHRARSTLSFSSRRSFGANSTGGSMANTASSWRMVLDDVAQRPGLVVELAPPLEPDRLGDRDLDRVDVAAVPDRLEQPVAEPEDGEVLDGLLAEVVVDPIDLLLGEDLADLSIQRLGRGGVESERLLDDDARPSPPTTAAFGLPARPAAPRWLTTSGTSEGWMAR